MQELIKKRPLYVATDVDQTLTSENESPFLKNFRIAYNKNDRLPTGTAGDTSQGGNFGSGTPLQGARLAIPEQFPMPAGINHTIGAYECQETNELYWACWNNQRFHGVYRLRGDTGMVDVVKIDTCFNFSLDPRFSLKNRMYLKVVYDSDNMQNVRVKAKYLVFTDGYNWQRWIDVETAIATAGYDPVLFPYFSAPPPHHDPCELINWIAAPPFRCPSTELVPFSQADVGKFNNLLYKSLQFAYQYIYTDGRTSVFSPYSSNVYVGTSACSQLTTNSPRCVRLTLSAGGPLVEKIRVFFRNCGGDWYLYDTIDKYDPCDRDEPFYTREIGLQDYNAEDNTFPYSYCGDKECGLYNAADALRVQEDIPIKSFAMTPVGDSVVLGNNLYNYNNFTCETLDNVEISIDQDEDDEGEDGNANCTPQNVTITAWVTTEGAPIVRVDNADGDVIFGTSYALKGFPAHYDRGVETVFANRQGFIGYLAGTPYATIGEQWRVAADGSMAEVGILNWWDNNVRNSILQTINDGGYYLSKFVFVVPRGRYLFRVASNRSDITDPGYQQTSTYIANRANAIGFHKEWNRPVWQSANQDWTQKELYIDACAGDVDTFADQDKLVLDTFVPIFADRDREKAFSGYITDTDNPDKKGMELLSYIVDEGFPETIRSGRYTDHNGFYWSSVQNGGANNSNVVFWGEYNCQLRTRDTWFIRTTHPRRPRGQKFFEQNLTVESVTGTYQLCNEVQVKGKIIDTDGNGIAGVNVVVTRGSTALTNSEGEFTLKVHRGNVRGILGDIIRDDKILFGAGSVCPLVSEDCTCIPVENFQWPRGACICPNVRIYPFVFNFTLRYASTNARALKGGGRYGFAIVGRDKGGRQTFANNIGYVDYPTFLERGNYEPLAVRWTITDEFVLPEDVSYISFYRTKNLNFGGYIQWVGDKIEFLNARGELITTTDEAVRARITIQSLIDFNRENNFATTVGYQFVQGDMLRVYDNGDGDLFEVTADTPFMDYQILGTDFNQSITGPDVEVPEDEEVVGRSFIIEYNKRLEALKDKCSFWIEIIRPHQCEQRELYFEICGTYAVENGKIMGDITTGILPTWDTYYQTRFIRPEGCSAKQINHPFESASITDFWGNECESGGRIAIADPQAYQQWHADDVIKSDDFVNTSQVNGLATFREANRKNFKGQEWGGIVAIHAERSVVCFICQNDFFITDYNMVYLRANREGVVVANLENTLSEPRQKTGFTYGCEYEDNDTIEFNDGLAIWADRKNAGVIIMDYNRAEDVARIENKGYFLSKFRHVIQHNAALVPERYLLDLIEISAGFDPKYREYVITFRPRRDLTFEPSVFINNERETFVDMQETFVFNLDMMQWARFTSYTPEGYGTLRKSATGMELITFVNGQPYFMNDNSVNYYNYFYGYAVDQVITLVWNYDPSKVKIFQSVTVESNSMQYYSDMVFTEERNSFSYIPPGYWVKREGIWYAEFLRDMSTYPDLEHPYVSMLADGKRIFGQFVWLRLVRDTRMRTGYNELNNLWVRLAGSERSEK